VFFLALQIILIFTVVVLLGFRGQNRDTGARNVFPKVFEQLQQDFVSFTTRKNCISITDPRWDAVDQTQFELYTPEPSFGPCSGISIKVRNSVADLILDRIKVLIVAPAPLVDLENALNNPNSTAMAALSHGDQNIWFPVFFENRRYTVKASKADGYVIYLVEG
jgi:hypothetical protein